MIPWLSKGTVVLGLAMEEVSLVHQPPNRHSHLRWQYEVDADQTFDQW